MSKCWKYIFLSAWTPRRQCAYVSRDKNVCLKKAFCQGLVSGFHVGWASSFEVLTLIDWVHNIFESLVPRCELSVCLDGFALLPDCLSACISWTPEFPSPTCWSQYTYHLFTYILASLVRVFIYFSANIWMLVVLGCASMIASLNDSMPQIPDDTEYMQSRV